MTKLCFKHCNEALFCGKCLTESKNIDKEELLWLIEFVMDRANGEYGTKLAYCIYCKAHKYDGKEGILHHENCIMKVIRKELRK